jgi:hypothetical protein
MLSWSRPNCTAWPFFFFSFSWPFFLFRSSSRTLRHRCTVRNMPLHLVGCKGRLGCGTGWAVGCSGQHSIATCLKPLVHHYESEIASDLASDGAAFMDKLRLGHTLALCSDWTKISGVRVSYHFHRSWKLPLLDKGSEAIVYLKPSLPRSLRKMLCVESLTLPRRHIVGLPTNMPWL